MNLNTTKFKTLNIKGRSYVEVKERILYLATEFDGDYTIETEYQYFPERKMWVVKAKLTLIQNEHSFVYTGLAQEVESDNYKEVNHTSALENAETSAVGRACAMAGIGIIDSIASADEMNKAMNRSEIQKQDARLERQMDEHIANTAKEELPWITEAQKDAVIKRIQAGDKDALQKAQSSFRIKRAYREEIEGFLKA